MELTLNRNHSIGNSTISKLFVNGEFECYILEDVIREIKGEPVSEWKVYGKTAIPEGRYKIIINMSNRFKRLMPLLLNVAGFSGVRIHAGNSAAHTEGFLLAGNAVKNGEIVGGTSRPAMDKLQKKIQAALDKGEQVWITIKNPQ
jgi:hypothetical protein